jgi:hypothetical protein
MRKSTKAKNDAARAEIRRRDSAPLIETIKASFTPDGAASFYRSLRRPHERIGHTWSQRIPPDGRATVAQAALLLDVTIVSFHRWIEAGELIANTARPVTIELASVRRLAHQRGKR